MRRQWAVATLIGLMTGLIGGCGDHSAVAVSGDMTENSIPRLTIGIAYGQPGLSTIALDGTLRGFQVDVAEYIARALGTVPAHIVWKEAVPSGRDAMIRDGAVDFVVTSFGIDDPHSPDIAFSRPYLTTGRNLLVRAANTDIKAPESLNGKTVCTAGGAAAVRAIQQNFAQGVKVTQMRTQSACVDALLADQVDAAITDEIASAGFVSGNRGGLRVVGPSFTRQAYGIAVRTGNTRLRRAIDDAIGRMISDGSWMTAMRRDIAPTGYQPAPPN